MARQYEDRVVFVGVPSADSEENMQDFVERHGLERVTHAIDHDKEVWGRFGVPGQPSWSFVTAGGEVTTHVGPLFGEGLLRQLEALLGEA